jgi:hypothetical protein
VDAYAAFAAPTGRYLRISTPFMDGSFSCWLPFSVVGNRFIFNPIFSMESSYWAPPSIVTQSDLPSWWMPFNVKFMVLLSSFILWESFEVFVVSVHCLH